MKKINWSKLITIVLATEFVGLIASLLSGNIKKVYMSINKPVLSPPSWVFGVVWSLLYLLIGVAAYIVYESEKNEERKKAIWLYWLQLFVNFIWPIVFFRFLMFKQALFIIVVLDFLVVITTKAFYNVNKYAGKLMIPYMLWLMFATYLNLGVALLN